MNSLKVVFKHIFFQSGAFVSAKQHIAEKANEAVFSLIKNIKRLPLPFDIQIDLFEKKKKKKKKLLSLYYSMAVKFWA